MPYPSRPVHSVLPEFIDTAGTRSQTAEQRARLRDFAATEYRRGRSLRELAELTGRTQTVLCTFQGGRGTIRRETFKQRPIARTGLQTRQAATGS